MLRFWEDPSAGFAAQALRKTNRRRLFPPPETEGQGEGKPAARRPRLVVYPKDSAVAPFDAKQLHWQLNIPICNPITHITVPQTARG